VVTNRTQGGEIAAAIEEEGRRGDVVVYCPDQLGPSVSRHLAAGFEHEAFPGRGSPGFVDWVDYAERNEAADPAAFAERVLRTTATDQDIWLVWATNYRTFDEKCEALGQELARGGRTATKVVDRDAAIRERQNLSRFATR
jgi:mannosyltransferase